MGLIKFLVGFGMIILFSIAIISYMSGFGSDNVVYTNISSDDELSDLSTNAQSEMESFTTSVNSSSNPFTQSVTLVNEEEIQSGSVWTTGRSLVDGSKNILRGGFRKIFGNDGDFGVIFTVIVALFMMILFAYIWKLLKGGNPD